MNKFLIEFLGSMFFIFVILSIGNPVAIGAALTLAILLGGKISGGVGVAASSSGECGCSWG